LKGAPDFSTPIKSAAFSAHTVQELEGILVR
jgi:hypothetical protein